MKKYIIIVILLATFCVKSYAEENKKITNLVNKILSLEIDNEDELECNTILKSLIEVNKKYPTIDLADILSNIINDNKSAPYKSAQFSITCEAIKALEYFGNKSTLKFLEQFYDNKNINYIAIEASIILSDYNEALVLKFLSNPNYDSLLYEGIYSKLIQAYLDAQLLNDLDKQKKILLLTLKGFEHSVQKSIDLSYIKQKYNINPNLLKNRLQELNEFIQQETKYFIGGVWLGESKYLFINELYQSSKNGEITNNYLDKNEDSKISKIDLEKAEIIKNSKETENQDSTETENEKSISLNAETSKSKILIIFGVLFTIIFGGFFICKTRKKKNRKQEEK